mgnify:CR=1 FL=1
MTAQNVSCRELKPCPFCGGSPAIAAEGEFGQWSMVFCGKCNAQTGVNLSESEAVAEWQARAQDSRCGELLEAAKELVTDPFYGTTSITVSVDDFTRLRKAIAAFEASHET